VVGADPPPTWRIYYGDYSTFSDTDGDPTAAPALNVQVITQALPDDPTVPRKLVSHHDFYWYDRGEWFGGDLCGLFDFLTHASVVKFGRGLSRQNFEAIYTRALTDSDFIPKLTWSTQERR
jgi:hypothetical protein